MAVKTTSQVCRRNVLQEEPDNIPLVMTGKIHPVPDILLGFWGSVHLSVCSLVHLPGDVNRPLVCTGKCLSGVYIKRYASLDLET